MRQYLKNEIFKISKWLELFLSAIIMIAVLGGAIWLVGDLFDLLKTSPETDTVYAFVGMAFNLVICIEFIKMLCKHSPDTLVEVLMFAIARQMIVEHTSPLENLTGIAAIAVLFAVKKFLFGKFDDVDKTIFLAREKISSVNGMLHVNIPTEHDGETLEELMNHKIEKDGEQFVEGQCYYFSGGALRVESIKADGSIRQVELIRCKDAPMMPKKY